MREQLQDTNAAVEEAAGIRCNFESECHWTWDKTLNNTFQVVNGKVRKRKRKIIVKAYVETISR